MTEGLLRAAEIANSWAETAADAATSAPEATDVLNFATKFFTSAQYAILESHILAKGYASLAKTFQAESDREVTKKTKIPECPHCGRRHEVTRI